MPTLTFDALVRKGYLPKEVPPPFTTGSLADFLTALLELAALEPKSSKCTLFSIPKSWPARRTLAIPNPLHQILLSREIVQQWAPLQSRFEVSQLCLSTPTVFENRTRAVSRKADFDQWSIERFQRSADARFVLRTDFSHFYHTIYTHSLPWAIHGKEVAKANHSSALSGNRLDTRVRNTQDQQTMGLPVGPDTSFILAEVIGAQIDCQLQSSLPGLKGIRYVDDFHFYCDTRAAAEEAYECLTRIAKQYELEVNDRKTDLFEGPDTGEPPWKTALKAQGIQEEARYQRSSLISFVSKAFETANTHRGEGVLSYAIKKSYSAQICHSISDIYEAFLRAALLYDPSVLPLVTGIIFRRYTEEQLSSADELRGSLAKFTVFHSGLRHEYEVSWALWLFRTLNFSLPDEAARAVCEMDDPFVALLALDLRDAGLAANLDTGVWERRMRADALYSEHWMLAYEALRRDWLQSAEGDYVDDDEFFSILDARDVSFYSPPEDSGVDFIPLPSEY